MLNTVYKNPKLFFLLILVLLIVSAHFFSFICPFVLDKNTCKVNYFEKNESLFRIFLISVVFGPLIETTLFQFLPIETYYRLSTNKSTIKKRILILITSIVFGFTHNYNSLTIIDASIAGIIFGTTFFYFKENSKSGFFLHF